MSKRGKPRVTSRRHSPHFCHSYLRCMLSTDKNCLCQLSFSPQLCFDTPGNAVLQGMFHPSSLIPRTCWVKKKEVSTSAVNNCSRTYFFLSTSAVNNCSRIMFLLINFCCKQVLQDLFLPINFYFRSIYSMTFSSSNQLLL